MSKVQGSVWRLHFWLPHITLRIWPGLGCHASEAVIIGDRMDTDIVAGTER